jgi:acyl-CoA thioesterase-2
MSETPETRQADTLLELLDLEEIDRDLYRAHNPRAWFTPHLYGGQVAAQAVRAAAFTVPEGRYPHSMHGYFLRRGDATHPTIMRVARDRDGKSFSARHIVALQRGEAIFTASMSFHVDEEGGEFPGTPIATDIPMPEDLAEWDHGMFTATFDLRGVFPDDGPRDARWRIPRQLWARSREPLPNDRVLHACGLVYLSDISNGFAELQKPGLPPGGPSLDHSIFFHRPLRLDDWLFMRLEPLSAAGARGVYWGSIHDRSGQLGVTIFQETLLRPPDA